MFSEIITELTRHVLAFATEQIRVRLGQEDVLPSSAVLSAIAPIIGDFAAVIVVERGAYDRNGRLSPRLRQRLDDEVLKVLDRLGILREY